MPLNIENIVIFTADSLRWDYLPQSVHTLGVSLKTVSQSTYSPPSFATIATGLYPQQHGVTHWTHRVKDGVSTIFDLNSYKGSFYQHNDVGDRMYDILEVENSQPLSSLEPPFVYLERNMMTHLPFNKNDSQVKSGEDANCYFERVGSDWEKLRSDYRRCTTQVADIFEARINELEDRDLLDETLIIFTSDHGELLGEYGDVAHTSPACPELVYVPTVLIHPEIDKYALSINTETEIIEHTDLVTTIYSALDVPPKQTAGTDLLQDKRKHPFGYNYVNANRWGKTFYAADSLWWRNSGFAFQSNSRAVRMAYLLYRLLNGWERSSLRRNIPELLKTYIRSNEIYGTPPVDVEEAERRLKKFIRNLPERQSEPETLDKSTRESLQELGYLN